MRLDEQQVVASVRRLELSELRVWVSEGWIRPAAGDHGPVFDELDVARIRLVCDLQQDLSLPPEAVPVVLSLLDQVHGLRRELRHVALAIDRQPEAVRRGVIEAYRALTAGRG